MEEEEKKSKENPVIFSKVEGDEFELQELVEHPEKFVIIDLDTTMICDRCHIRYSIMKFPNYITMRCGCGCRIFYPKNSKGVIITTFKSKEEYEARNGNARKQNSYSTRTDD